MRSYIDVKDCIKLGARNMTAAIAKINGKEYNIQFTKQRTGYGEKLFLVCPKCGSRRTKLYLYGDGLLCRECYPFPVYDSIKNVSIGSYNYISYRMLGLVRRERIPIKFPFHYLEYEKPKYKQFDKWHMTITKLQALENMRNQAIFFGKKYSRATINSIFEERNLYLYVCDLYDLDLYFYDWDVGFLKYPGNEPEVKPTGVMSQAGKYQRAVLGRYR